MQRSLKSFSLIREEVPQDLDDSDDKANENMNKDVVIYVDDIDPFSDSDG